MLIKKQQDFEKEGIPIDFFFQLANNLVVGLKQHLNG